MIIQLKNSSLTYPSPQTLPAALGWKSFGLALIGLAPVFPIDESVISFWWKFGGSFTVWATAERMPPVALNCWPISAASQTFSNSFTWVRTWTLLQVLKYLRTFQTLQVPTRCWNVVRTPRHRLTDGMVPFSGRKALAVVPLTGRFSVMKLTSDPRGSGAFVSLVSIFPFPLRS